MTKDEALKLALEALNHLQPTALTSFYTIGDRDKAITAIKKALAQPERPERGPKTYALLYPQADYVATPDERPWVGLTKEEIDSALSKYQNWYDFAAHLENILKEKNQ